MAKDKIKLSFEIDRFKLIGKLARNCETTEEYQEMLAIIDRTDEVIAKKELIDEEVEDEICASILKSIALDNPNAAFVKRLIKERNEEQQEQEIPDNEEDGLLGAVKIEGEDAKAFLRFIKKLITKHSKEE